MRNDRLMRHSEHLGWSFRRMIALIVLSVLLCLFSACRSAPLSSSTDSKGSQSITDRSVVAIVNGKKLSYSDFQEKKKAYALFYQIQTDNLKKVPEEARAKVKTEPGKKSDRQLLQDSILTQVILDDCQKQKIAVSTAEAKQAAEADFAELENQSKNGSELEKKQAKETLDAYNSFAKSLGLSLDEYIQKQEVGSMQTMMLQTKHYQNFAKSMAAKNLSSDQIAKQYEEYKQKLVRSSSIQINETLLNR